VDSDSYKEALLDQIAQEARRDVCRTCANNLQRFGKILWAFGFADDPQRRALATILQMGGSIGTGCVAMLETGNYYAATALSRQLVEIEYLVWLFGIDTSEAQAWLSSSQEDLRKTYSPSEMRRRSDGRFRDQEYWSHCEIGGHPNPKAAFLLPNHILPGYADLLPTPQWVWVDLGQHLERLWSFTEIATETLEFDTVKLVPDAGGEVKDALRRWHEVDVCADRLERFPEVSSE